MVGLVNSVGVGPAANQQTRQTGRTTASFPDDAGSPPMWVRPQGASAETETSRAVTPPEFDRFAEQRNVSEGDELSRAEQQASSDPSLGNRVDLFA